MWSDSTWANLSTYAKLGLLTWLTLQDPVWMDPQPGQSPFEMAERVIDRLRGNSADETIKR
jgi:hypothetical protein